MILKERILHRELFDLPVYSTMRGWACLRRRYRKDSRPVPDTAPSTPLRELLNISGTSGWRTLWSVRREVSCCTLTKLHTNTHTCPVHKVSDAVSATSYASW